VGAVERTDKSLNVLLLFSFTVFEPSCMWVVSLYDAKCLLYLFSTDIFVYLTSFVFSLLLISDIRWCTFLKLCFIDPPWQIVLLILSYLFSITPSTYQANKA